MSLGISQLYEFGRFRLDTQERVLWCDGQLVLLTPKLLETLIVLVERHGHIVDKQELLERVWPDTFVEEANVTRHVSLLRKTLNEWADASELIETLPRRGYRFTAPVRQLAPTQTDLPAYATPAPLLAVPDSAQTVPNISDEAELIVTTHTITRITAEEETDEPDWPLSAPPLALPAAPTVWWRKRRVWVTGVLVLLVSVAGLWFFLVRNQAALSEKDTLLLAEFVNRTGDSVFDGTLRQGLAVQLEQSPFLTFLSDQRVRETLKLMTRSPEEHLTPEIGREICVRQGLKALIRGEIAPLGSHYVVTLEAIAGQTGDTLARAQSEAESKEQVLHALSLAASDLRGKLGESLSSLQKYAAMLETTTASLPALQNLTLGLTLNRQGKPLEAIPFTQRAVELDPNFANAWATHAAFQYNTRQYKEAAESAARAFALRDRATELERFRIDVWYHFFTTNNLEKTVEVSEQFRRVYPRNSMAHNTLSRAYFTLGQFALAEAPAREAIRLNSAARILPENLAEILLHQNRLAESRALLNELSQSGPATLKTQELRYRLACLEEDAAAQQSELAALNGQPEEYRAWKWRADRAFYLGQLQTSQSALRQALDLSLNPQLRGEAANLVSEGALTLALLCQNGAAQPACDSNDFIQQALARERNTFTLTNSMLALALNNRGIEAAALAAELARQSPENTLLKTIWLPLFRAVQALHNHQPGQAIEELRPAEHYEAAARFYPQYVRGLAWLQLKNGAAAATEFEKIRAHRYLDPLSPFYPLAHLGLARAAALQGDPVKSRQWYAEFFRLWKDADADLPALRMAKDEFARMP